MVLVEREREEMMCVGRNTTPILMSYGRERKH